jgi:hypothetical protein
MNTTKITSNRGKSIITYTRAQAIAEGLLVDVSNMADKAGFKIPVAVTQTVWDNYIHWTDEDTHRRTFQDPTSRQWNVLCLLRVALNKLIYTDCILYNVYIMPRYWHCPIPVSIQLKAVIERGDQGEPVITIRLPYED